MTIATADSPFYQQKDLGRPRPTTDAKIIVRIRDEKCWAIPLQLIADHRDYTLSPVTANTVDTVQEYRSGIINNDMIVCWADNYMKWSDVEQWAKPYAHNVIPTDQREWSAAFKFLMGRV